MSTKRFTKEELETIIRYDMASNTASIYTTDRAFIRRIDNLRENYTELTERKRDKYGCWYECPKSWIKIKPPRIISDEKLAELRANAARNFRVNQQRDNP